MFPRPEPCFLNGMASTMILLPILCCLFLGGIAVSYSNVAAADPKGSAMNTPPAPTRAQSAVATAAPGVRTPKLLEKRDLRECSQNCTYEEANAKIDFMKKVDGSILDELKKKRDASGNFDTAGKALIKANLVCAQNESEEDCFKRNTYYHALSVFQARKAMQDNSVSQGNLLTRKVPANPPGLKAPSSILVDWTATAHKDAPSLENTVPEMPTLDELKTDYSRLRDMTTQEYEAWADELVKAPQPMDFIKVEKILRDPDDPASGTFDRIVLNADGTPQIDDIRYQAALKFYHKKFNGVSDQRNQKKEILQVGKQSIPKYTGPRDLASDAKANNQGHFRAVRNANVRTINALIDEKFSGKPAAKQSAATAAAGSLDEQVKPMPILPGAKVLNIQLGPDGNDLERDAYHLNDIEPGF